MKGQEEGRKNRMNERKENWKHKNRQKQHKQCAIEKKMKGHFMRLLIQHQSIAW